MLKKILLFVGSLTGLVALILILVNARSNVVYAYDESSTNPNLMEVKSVFNQKGSYKNTSYIYTFDGGLFTLNSVNVGAGDMSFSYNQRAFMFDLYLPTSLTFANSDLSVNNFTMYNEPEYKTYTIIDTSSTSSTPVSYDGKMYYNLEFRTSGDNSSYYAPNLPEYAGEYDESFNLNGRLYIHVYFYISYNTSGLSYSYTNTAFEYNSSDIVQYSFNKEFSSTFYVSSTYQGSRDLINYDQDSTPYYTPDNGSTYYLSNNRFYYSSLGVGNIYSNSINNLKSYSSSGVSFVSYNYSNGNLTINSLKTKEGEYVTLINDIDVMNLYQYYSYYRLNNDITGLGVKDVLSLYWSYTNSNDEVKYISCFRSTDDNSITDINTKVDFNSSSISLVAYCNANVTETVTCNNVYSIYLGLVFDDSPTAPIPFYSNSYAYSFINKKVQEVTSEVGNPVYPFNVATYKIYYSTVEFSINDLPSTYISKTYDEMKELVDFGSGLTIDSNSKFWTLVSGAYCAISVDFGSSAVSSTGFNTFTPSGDNVSLQIFVSSYVNSLGGVTDTYYTTSSSGVSCVLPDSTTIKTLVFKFKGINKATLATNTSYSEGYSTGLANGKSQGYDSGYDDGYNDGYSLGNQNGYNTGYKKGYNQTAIESNDNNTIGALASSILNFPLTFLKEVFNVEFLGINLYGLISFLISCTLLGFVIHIVRKGLL